jgi:hypothetical protein
MKEKLSGRIDFFDVSKSLNSRNVFIVAIATPSAAIFLTQFFWRDSTYVEGQVGPIYVVTFAVYGIERELFVYIQFDEIQLGTCAGRSFRHLVNFSH